MTAHFKRCVGRQRLPRLVDASLAAEHLAGEDQRLRARARFDETAIHQQLICALTQEEFTAERAERAE
jgi:hypothetical protein